MNKKGISPLFATFLLVVFALVVGGITMTWGKNYIEKSQHIKGSEIFSGTIIKAEQLDDPLKSLQLTYIIGEITKESYLQKEQEFLRIEGEVAASSCSNDAECINGFSCWYKVPLGAFTGIKASSNNLGKCYSENSLDKLK